MTDQPFNPLERLLVDRARSQASEEFWSGLARVPLALLLIGILALAVLVEFSLFYGVFSYLKAPMPGEDNAAEIILLSLSSLVMILAFHFKARENPDGPLKRTVALLAGVLVIIYVVGAGGVLAATVWFDGADAVFGGDDGLVAEMAGFLDGAVAQAKSGTVRTLLEDQVFPALSVLFVAGMGGLSLCILYLSHGLLDGLEAQGPYLAQMWNGAQRLRIARRVARLQAQHDELERRHARVKRQIASAPARVAGLVHATYATALCETEKLLNGERLELTPGMPKFPRVVRNRPLTGLNTEYMRELLEQAKAYGIREIIADIESVEAGGK